MRPSLLFFAPVSCLLSLTGCGGSVGDRARFQGEVALRVGSAEHRGRLTFARPGAAGAGTLQFDETRDGHAENVTLVPPANVVAFRDGVPRPVTKDERRLMAALAAVFAWGHPLPEVEAPIRVPGAAAARFADGTELEVTVIAEGAAGPHGG